MRDLETIALAVEAASTGHLVFGTLYTQSAAKTVDRIIDVFPYEQQEQIRATLADSLQAVIAQTLFKRRDTRGRCAALEILFATPAVRNLIRDAKTFQIPTVLQTGKKFGMQSLDDAILDHLEKGRIHPTDAYLHCLDKARFRAFLRNVSDEDLVKGEARPCHARWISSLITFLIIIRSSDINVSVGRPFQVEVDGELIPVELPVLSRRLPFSDRNVRAVTAQQRPP